MVEGGGATAGAPAARGVPASAHPPALRTLFFTEMWERFSYYGMRAMLVLFMVDLIEHGGLGMDERTATAVYGLYTAAVYLAALPGGWIADRLLGARNAVWWGGVIIACGHFTLALPTPLGFFPGLVLVVLGTGLLKPNVSTLVGSLYGREEHARRDSGFTFFYMGINLGAALGPLACSTLGENPLLGWHYGFGAAGVGMLLGLTQYRLGLARFGAVGAAPEAPLKNARLGWGATLAGAGLIALLLVLGLAGLWRPDAVQLARNAAVLIAAVFILYFLGVLALGRLSVPERRGVMLLGALAIISALFWAGFEQAGSSFNLFAKQYTARRQFGFEIPAGWFQSLNPVFVIILAPLFASLWVRLAARGLDPSTPLKFLLAMLLLALGFAVMLGAVQSALAAGQAPPLWLISTYLVHTMGEMCLSPVGLSAVSRYAPRRYTGQMMGAWFMTLSLGSLLAGLIAGELSAAELREMPSLYGQLILYSLGVAAGLLLLLPILGRWARAKDETPAGSYAGEN